MREPERTVLTVVRNEGAWAVEYDGERFGHSVDKEVAKASAYKRAREMIDAGRSCQVRIWGEPSFVRSR
jgi:hypothetical protein